MYPVNEMHDTPRLRDIDIKSIFDYVDAHPGVQIAMGAALVVMLILRFLGRRKG